MDREAVIDQKNGRSIALKMKMKVVDEQLIKRNENSKHIASSPITWKQSKKKSLQWEFEIYEYNTYFLGYDIAWLYHLP